MVMMDVVSLLLMAQVRRLGLKVGSRLMLFRIHRVNRVNSCNDSRVMKSAQ